MYDKKTFSLYKRIFNNLLVIKSIILLGFFFFLY